MYTDEFKYANELTTSIDDLKKNPWALVDKIKDMVNNYDEYKLKNVELQHQLEQFFDGTKLYQAIKDSVDAV